MKEEQVCQIPESNENEPKVDLAFLDHPDVWKKWVTASKNSVFTVRLQVPSIHCASCVQVLERLYMRKSGILVSRVHFLTRELEISFQPALIKFSELVQYLRQLGYGPSLADPQQFGNKRKALSESTKITIRMAVAGFCAGNIMLLSFPEYLGLEDLAFRHFFGYLNLILALPAVFFSGWVYFKSVYNALIHKVLNIDVPIGVGMLATFILSLYEIISQTGSGYFDSLTGLIFFLLMGRWVQNRTYQYLSFERDFRSYFPLSITRMAENGEETILSSEIKPGDFLRIHFGEIIPCDGLLVDGLGKIDYSFVSGESILTNLKKGERVLAGGKQMGGSILVKAEQELSRSQLTNLWNNPVFQKEGKPPLQSFTDTVAYYFTPVILVFATMVAGFWLFADPSKSLHSFLAILIIACPCTLALSYPIALGNAMRIWGKWGFFLKNVEVVERLAQVETLVFDKTGTLTQKLGVEVRFYGKELNEDEKHAIFSVLSNSRHPLSQSVVSWFEIPKPEQVEDFNEVEGKGVEGKVGKIWVRAGSANWVGNEEVHVAGSMVFVSINGENRGFFEIKAAPHPFVEAMLESLSKRFSLNMLSGDREQEQSYWQTLFARWGGYCGLGLSPEEKLAQIENWQKAGWKVGMIGDGLNDSGALRKADIGIALAGNAHQFTPGSDAILLAEKLPLLPQFLQHARKTLKVVRFSFLLSVIYNIIGLTFAVRGDLQPIVAAILMPLNSLTMVVVAWVGSNRKNFHP